MNGRLTIRGGAGFDGALIGAKVYRKGRLVLFRGPFDPQFLLTDPCTKGQIILSTEPVLGTVGVRMGLDQSDRIYASGLVCREVADFPTYYGYYKNLGDMLERNRVPALTYLDTDTAADIAMIEPPASIARVYGNHVPSDVSAYLESDLEGLAVNDVWTSINLPVETVYKNPDRKDLVLITDLGQRSGMLDFFRKRFNVLVIPPFGDIDEIPEDEPLGLIISNGPGDLPTDGLAKWIGDLLDNYPHIPKFAVGMGCLAAAMNMGMGVEELPLPHRGSSIPVIGRNGRFLTYQNHRFNPGFRGCNDILERCAADGFVESAYDPDSGIYFSMYDPLPDLCDSWARGPLGLFLEEIQGGCR